MAYDYSEENRRALERSVRDDAHHARAIREACKAVGESLGAAGGGAGGAFIGSLILPGAGTAIGLALGAALGGGAGAYVGSRVADKLLEILDIDTLDDI